MYYLNILFEHVGALLSLPGLRFLAFPSFSSPVLTTLLAAVVFALALWGVGEPPVHSTSAQTAVHEVCAKLSTETTLQGGATRQACPVGESTLTEVASSDAVDSEPLQHDRQSIPDHARWMPRLTLASYHPGPLLPGPFRPPAA